MRGEYSSVGRRDIRFIHSRIDAAKGRPIAPDGAAEQRLWRVVLVLEGRLDLQSREGMQTCIEPGDLVLVDAARIAHAQWTTHRALWLLIPRQHAHDTLVANSPAVVRPVDALHAAALQAQLRVLERHADVIGVEAAESLLLGLRELTPLVFAMAHAPRPPRRREEEAFRIATRFLHAHSHRVDLRLDEVAEAVGCSRSVLYRLFADHGTTLAGYLRELRLLRCRRALSLASPRSNIEQIAYRHGFGDLHAFCHLFKQRFGMTPGQARRRGTKNVDADVLAWPGPANPGDAIP